MILPHFSGGFLQLGGHSGVVRHRERLDALGVAAFAQDVVVKGVAPDAAWKEREIGIL